MRINSKSYPAGPRWAAHRVKLLPEVFALILIAAACGGGDDAAATDETSATERVAESLDEQGPVSALSFDLVGGEVTRNFDDLMGWAFADQPLDSMSSPGPRIEVRLGDEVTINFTNRHGWSQDPDDEFYSSVDQSFRIYETGGSVGDVLWGADTGLVAPGETASVTFTPDQVGEYRYTSVGLVMTGMWGAFVVLDNP